MSLPLDVATANGCDYCRTAHGIAARALRRSSPEDPAVALQVAFARRVFETCGKVPDDEIAAARDAGLDDATMIDIVAVIAENVLGNLVNNLARTELDEVLLRRSERA